MPFAPDTPGGQHVLAHELAHTLQQGVDASLQRAGERLDRFDNGAWVREGLVE